jgi:hypothetical protein
MVSTRVIALAAVLVSGAVAHADDLTPLYPRGVSFAMGIDVKAIYASPLGKKVVGKDKPFDVARKLTAMILANESESLFKSIAPLEPLINRLDRITVVGGIAGESRLEADVFMEGDIDEAELTRAAEAFADVAKLSFQTEKLGDRKLIIIGDNSYAVRVNKSLAVFASSRERLSEILEQHSGKMKTKPQPALLEGLKQIKKEEAPVWLVMGKIPIIGLGITRLVGTISFGVDAGIRIEASTETEDQANKVVELLKVVHEAAISYLKEPAKGLWQAADLKAKQDGKTVTVTGQVSGARLAEEYAKLK